jgi:RNA polymerase sigma factor (sigma-70 family)
MRRPRPIYDSFTVADLTRAFVGGDIDALDELMFRLGKVPFAAALQQLGSAADAEEVAQETWLRFMQHAAEIREPERLAGWLWVTAANEARRRGKRDARLRLVERLEDVPADDSEPVWATSDFRQAVTRAVEAKLTERERDLLGLLIDSRGLDYRQISAYSSRPVGAIGPTRARIIRKLQSYPDVAARGAIA